MGEMKEHAENMFLTLCQHFWYDGRKMNKYHLIRDAVLDVLDELWRSFDSVQFSTNQKTDEFELTCHNVRAAGQTFVGYWRLWRGEDMKTPNT